MKKKIILVNGPNLSLLGVRQKEIYGTQTLSDIILKLKEQMSSSFDLHSFQSNIEGEIVSFLNTHYLENHKEENGIAGIIINPGAYSHSSIAIRDALEMFLEHHIPIYEVHLSNIFAREEFRHHSYISSIASGIISGLGAQGYEFALQKILNIAESLK